MTLSLPPPVIFTHEETLHAIELPPLATFLSALSVPEHLLKLNDILLRYRTPKSYHRVDVREISSSELPLSSPEPEQAGGRARTVKDKGEPVILEEGDTVEQYKARQEAGQSRTAEEESAQNGHISPAVPGEPPTTPIGKSFKQRDSRPTDTLLSSTPIDQNTCRSKSPTPPTTVRLPKRTSTTPPHTLPPIGPKRRVRELRLDLRTLDAAALFALETWRRELMGLEKLGLEHPDSIWFKDPTPTPTPTPSPEPVKRKRGRPSRASSGKSQSKTPAVEVDEEEEEVSKASMGLDLAENVHVDANTRPAEDMDPATYPDGHEILEGKAASVDTARTKSVEQDDIQDVDAFDILVDGSVNDNTEAMSTSETAENGNGDQAPVKVDELESSPVPASPDIIIMDGFNRHDDDSDFSPERSQSPVLKRSRPNYHPPQSSFQTVPSPATMGSTGFQAAPEPVAMRIHAQPPIALGSSAPQRAPTSPTIIPSTAWFQDAPPARRLGSPSRAVDAETRINNALPHFSSRRSSGRPLSLSPTRPPIPIHQPPIQEGGTSDSPFLIPDSPEKRVAKVGFVPFIREQMRIPTFTKAPVVPSKGLHWHDSDKSRGSGRKRKEMEDSESRPKARRRSSITRVHFAEEEEEEDEEEEEMVEQVDNNSRQGRKRRAGDSDDDEWADFRF